MPADDDLSHEDLRGGRALWSASSRAVRRRPLETDLHCDVVVVGAGITGSLVAEHLTELGRRVVVLDRERPGFGSTAASTAMLMWEIDSTLTELAAAYGFDIAAGVYRRSVEAVAALAKTAAGLGLRPRDSLYLAGPGGSRELLAEHDLRRRAGLPGEYLDHATLVEAFGFDRPAAIWSPGCADANPLRLAHGLMERAVAAGAEIYDAEAVAYEPGSTVTVATDRGHVVEARHCVLATGYTMPPFVPSALHSTSSTWAVATAPQPRLWRDELLVWEAADPYLYARTTPDGRIVAGGEDADDVTDPDERDRLIPAKSASIMDKLSALVPGIVPDIEYAWAGEFGETSDGLPLIGPVPGYPGCYAAYGYGGNGITFSLLAARLIGQMIGGRHEPWFDVFAVDRTTFQA